MSLPVLPVVHDQLALSLADYLIHVPAGCTHPSEDLADDCLTSSIGVRYPCRDNLCLVDGFASALYYTGFCSCMRKAEPFEQRGS